MQVILVGVGDLRRADGLQELLFDDQREIGEVRLGGGDGPVAGVSVVGLRFAVEQPVNGAGGLGAGRREPSRDLRCLVLAGLGPLCFRYGSRQPSAACLKLSFGWPS